jgi:hypothetical protein
MVQNKKAKEVKEQILYENPEMDLDVEIKEYDVY